MSICKIVIASGKYLDKAHKVMVAFDMDDRPVYVWDLTSTLIGREYLATVEKVLKDISACILNLGNGIKGFIQMDKLNTDDFVLYQTDRNPVSQGDKLYVKIIKDKKYNKPYSCKQISSFSNANCQVELVADLIDNLPIHDTLEIITDDEKIADAISGCRHYADELSLWSLYSFSSIIDHLISARVHLGSGANIVFDYAEAGTIIDVNSANASKCGSSFDINKQAASEIVRQLKLRNISGIIIIDFLKMNDKIQETEIINLLKDLSSDDICQTNIYEFTRLGLLEMTRMRKMSPLHEIFTK